MRGIKRSVYANRDSQAHSLGNGISSACGGKIIAAWFECEDAHAGLGMELAKCRNASGGERHQWRRAYPICHGMLNIPER